jgi:hypothetical protein
MNWWAAVTLLSVYSKLRPEEGHFIIGLDVGEVKDQSEKANLLSEKIPQLVAQLLQQKNPQCIISFDVNPNVQMLCDLAKSTEGLSTGDGDRFLKNFWEDASVAEDWAFFHGTAEETEAYGGLSEILHWQKGLGDLSRFDSARVQGHYSWGKKGVLLSRMNRLKCTLYFGTIYDKMAVVLVPNEQANLPALWTFCSSKSYHDAVRSVSQNVAVATATLAQVPFDLAYWQKVAAERYPGGLPTPQSDDPTQWLFNGHPSGSTQPLHVAVARLLGYRWPRQTGSSFPDCPALGLDGLESFADEDGIVCLPPLNREQPAAARLRQLLTAALGTFDERALIAAAGLKGSKSKNIEDWLRDEFFEQHAKLFQDRPFIWHVWDGRADGFNALVNYHRLDQAKLQKLTYSYLGDWIRQQDEDAKADKPGAAERLGAARSLQIKLAAILEGEAPLDIFVRWKSLKEQALGWNPDLNDGVRQNIRPFLFAGDVGKRGAGVLRTVPLKLKDKDRGTEPNRPKKEYPWFWCEAEPGTDPPGGKDFVGNRWNNAHLTLARKREAKETKLVK